MRHSLDPLLINLLQKIHMVAQGWHIFTAEQNSKYSAAVPWKLSPHTELALLLFELY